MKIKFADNQKLMIQSETTNNKKTKQSTYKLGDLQYVLIQFD